MIDDSNDEITLTLSDSYKHYLPYCPGNVTSKYPNILFLQNYCCDTDILRKISVVFNGKNYLLFDEENWARSNEGYWIQYDEEGYALPEKEGWTHFDEEEWMQNKFEEQWNKYTNMIKEELIKFLDKITPNWIYEKSSDIFDVKHHLMNLLF